ncbi:MAG: hypothetical protein DI603_15220 [Roseateles depolymerans]|uniref:Uncharacterized protein n=1 Tax=Roseateles depolymerans TaxID=76731 RepID=A0A2W5FHK7_9BURK|nr:MAG: hypothetical protein DI603_15220 [Roseateles depolymerans]
MLIYRFQPRTYTLSRAREIHRTRRRSAGLRPMLSFRFLEQQCAPGAIWLRIYRPKVRLTLIRERKARPEARKAVFRRSGPLRCVRALRWHDTYEFMAPRHPRHRRGYGLTLASVAAHRLPAFGCVEVPF